jgi:hypothetical protein
MLDKAPKKLVTQGFLVAIEMEEWVDPGQVGKWMSGKLYALEGVFDVDVTCLGPVECLNGEEDKNVID